MKLTGIHHASLVVTDMERARRFYGEVLGLRPIARPSNFTNPVVWFQLGDEHIHLIPSSEADAISPRHIALHVEDARAARDYLRGQRVAVEETEPIAGADRFFIHDPDGNRIEVIQWSTPWDPEGRSERAEARGGGG
jgi:catechol 2,3-dioxygenase-like lactoylglutathione lyase family enzyme